MIFKIKKIKFESLYLAGSTGDASGGREDCMEAVA